MSSENHYYEFSNSSNSMPVTLVRNRNHYIIQGIISIISGILTFLSGFLNLRCNVNRRSIWDLENVGNLVHDYYEQCDFFMHTSSNVIYSRIGVNVNTRKQNTIVCEDYCPLQNPNYMNYGFRSTKPDNAAIYTWIIMAAGSTDNIQVGLQCKKEYMFSLNDVNSHSHINRASDTRNIPKIWCIVYNSHRGSLSISTKRDTKRNTLWFGTKVIREILTDVPYRFVCSLPTKNSSLTIVDYYFRTI